MTGEMLDKLRVPFVHVPARHQNIIPTVDGSLERAIFSQVKGGSLNGRILHQTEDFILVQIPNPRPHHPKTDGLNCVVRTHDWERPWDFNIYTNMLRADGLIGAIDDLCDGKESQVMYMGYAGGKTQSSPYVAKHGLATVEPIHSHSIGSFTDVKTDGYLNLGVEKDAAAVARILNFAGNEMIKRYEEKLHDFGQALIFSQKFQLEDGGTFENQIIGFGFSSTEEALAKTFNLQAFVAQNWLNTAIEIGLQYSQAAHVVLRQVRHSPVPTAALVWLSEELRNKFNVPKELRVIAIPFVAGSVTSMFEGIHLERERI